MTEVRIDPEVDVAIRRATLVVVQTFRELAGAAYASVGHPLTDDVMAADALVGSLMEGLVNRYGVDAARLLFERVASQAGVPGPAETGEPVFVNVETGRVRGGG